MSTLKKQTPNISSSKRAEERPCQQLGNALWASAPRATRRGAAGAAHLPRTATRDPGAGNDAQDPARDTGHCFNWKGVSVTILQYGFKRHLLTTDGLKRPVLYVACTLAVIFQLRFYKLLLPFHSSKFLHTNIWWGMEEAIKCEAYLGYVQIGKFRPPRGSSKCLGKVFL